MRHLIIICGLLLALCASQYTNWRLQIRISELVKSEVELVAADADLKARSHDLELADDELKRADAKLKRSDDALESACRASFLTRR